MNELYQPAQAELNNLITQFVEKIPYLISGLLLIILFFGIAYLASKLMRWALRSVVQNKLILNVITKLSAIFIVLIGFYLGLKITGLTQLAATILGGTGVAGLIFGFAFRDIAENFLASLLLSFYHPFKIGDLVEIEGNYGIVQKMTTRCTVIMNLDGDHIQIPNGQVFKSIIKNTSTNRNQRQTFTVGVGFDASLSKAQSVILKVLNNHPQVLSEPAPSVLIDELGSATVQLKIFFWVDITQYNPFKVKSSAVRMTKITLENNQISMPDEAREIIFPQGVPVEMTERSAAATGSGDIALDTDAAPESEQLSNAETHNDNLKNELMGQMETSSTAEKGNNIL